MKTRLFARYIFTISGVLFVATFDHLELPAAIIMSIVAGAATSGLWIMLRHGVLIGSMFARKSSADETFSELEVVPYSSSRSTQHKPEYPHRIAGIHFFKKPKRVLRTYYAEHMGDVTVLEGIKCITAHSFSHLSFVRITIPDSVENIAECAFEKCSTLAEISVSPDNPFYSSHEGVLFNKDKTILICCPQGKTGVYTIPGGVTTVSPTAFSDCKRLANIIIPDSVTCIGDSAFFGCASLSSITIPDRVTSIRPRLFAGCRGLASVTIGKHVVHIEDAVFFNCNSLTRITVPSSVISVGDRAFEGCRSLVNIIIYDIGIVDVSPYDVGPNSEGVLSEKIMGLIMSGPKNNSENRSDRPRLILSPNHVAQPPTPYRRYPCGTTINEGRDQNDFNQYVIKASIWWLPKASVQSNFPIFVRIWEEFDEHYEWLLNMYGHVYGTQGDLRLVDLGSVEPSLHYLEYCECCQELAEYLLINLLQGFTGLQALAAFCLDRVLHKAARPYDASVLFNRYPGRFILRCSPVVKLLGWPFSSVGVFNGSRVGRTIHVKPLAPHTRRHFGCKTALDWIRTGNDSLAKKDVLLALLAYDLAIDVAPDHAVAWHNKGVALHKLCAPGQAVKAFEKALEFNAGMEQATVCRNMVLAQLDLRGKESKGGMVLG